MPRFVLGLLMVFCLVQPSSAAEPASKPATPLAADGFFVQNKGALGQIFAFEFAYGALQESRVHLESDGFDLAALLPAKQIAGTAKFEIESCNLESGSQIGKLFQCSETAASDGRQLLLRRN